MYSTKTFNETLFVCVSYIFPKFDGSWKIKVWCSLWYHPNILSPTCLPLAWIRYSTSSGLNSLNSPIITTTLPCNFDYRFDSILECNEFVYKESSLLLWIFSSNSMVGTCIKVISLFVDFYISGFLIDGENHASWSLLQTKYWMG